MLWGVETGIFLADMTNPGPSHSSAYLDGVYNVAMAISNNYVPLVTERQRVWLFSRYFWLVGLAWYEQKYRILAKRI